jgi:probable rRNA maturation factor
VGKLFISFSATERFEECNYSFKRAIREAIKKTLLYEGFDSDVEVSVTLCSGEYIRKLNKEYRNKDSSTDVLSFPMYEGGELDEAECIGGALLGDVVISLERTEEQAAELGNSFIRELSFLAIHSTLHLLGYDHERSRQDEEIQCEKQRNIIEGLGEL